RGGRRAGRPATTAAGIVTAGLAAIGGLAVGVAVFGGSRILHRLVVPSLNWAARRGTSGRAGGWRANRFPAGPRYHDCRPGGVPGRPPPGLRSRIKRSMPGAGGFEPFLGVDGRGTSGPGSGNRLAVMGIDHVSAGKDALDV